MPETLASIRRFWEEEEKSEDEVELPATTIAD
jgi:cell pole-organizing protein PopZ